MKKVKYLAMLLAAGMFAACSDNLEDAGAGNAGGTTSDKGYIRIALNLPTTSGENSRAANDDFEDGIAAEYAVNNAILVLFTGTAESSATYSQAFNLTPTLESQPSDNVTTRYTTQAIEINKPATGNVYGLVILNNNGLFQVTTGTSGAHDKLQWKKTTSGQFEDFTGALSQLNTGTGYAISDIATLANSTATTGGFFMTNSPKASVKGRETQTNQDVTTLVKLSVQDSEDDANAAAPDEIYVERAVAKTTVKVKAQTNTSLTISSGDFNGATVNFEGWLLNTTNTVTYLVRNVSAWKTWSGYTMPTGATANSGNRFFGNDDEFYRVYWAIDPNYDTAAGANILQTYSSEDYENSTITWGTIDNSATAAGSEHPQYCLENTTNETQMKEKELTGVLFKTTFTPSGANAGDNFFMLGKTSEIYTEKNFLNLVNTILNLTNDDALTSDDITGKGGTYNTASEVATWLGITEEQATKLLADSRFSGDIKFYQNGVAYYYSAFIKHFGDDLTPYTNGAYTAADHLGRYGVVRNNWYELTVTEVSGPGSPEIPEPDPGDTPDDEESWIRCAINILSWAKRTQDVEL